MPFIPYNANRNTHFTMCVPLAIWRGRIRLRAFLKLFFDLKSQALIALHISHFVRVHFLSFIHTFFHVYSIRLTVSNSIRVFFLFCDAKRHWTIRCPENTTTNLRRQEISRANNTHVFQTKYICDAQPGWVPK